jgi:archaellum component FlaC
MSSGPTLGQDVLLRDIQAWMRQVEKALNQQGQMAQGIADAVVDMDKSLSQLEHHIQILQQATSQRPASSASSASSSDSYTIDQIRSDVSAIKSDLRGGWFSQSMPSQISEIRDEVRRMAQKLDKLNRLDSIEERLKTIERKVA